MNADTIDYEALTLVMEKRIATLVKAARKNGHDMKRANGYSSPQPQTRPCLCGCSWQAE